MGIWYECENCGHIFEEGEADTTSECYEDENGVGDMFEDRHYHDVYCCPECGCADLCFTEDPEDVEDDYEEEFDDD